MKCRLYLMKGFALLILCLFAGGGLWAQSKTVQGTVTDDNGPVIGVSVTVQGTTTGVSTGANGSYSIRVPNNNAVLDFNFLGYEPVTITVGDRTTIDVVLAENTQVIDDVVVIGYGTVRRRDVTGAVSSVSGEDIATMPISNAAQALQGRIAGVSVSAVDGRPDASVSVRVRGGGSITQSNEPLYIVDGFPVSNISDVPASQIESIDILKDASSTAIYGARGANGVIIVTTKAPKGEKFTISYNGYVQYKEPVGTIDVLNPYEYALINWEYHTLSQSATQIASYERAMAIGSHKNGVTNTGQAYDNPGGIGSYKNQRAYNWMEEMTRTAFSHSHNLTLSGGTAKNKYSIDYNFVDDPGIRINSGYSRSNVIAKFQQNLAKGLDLNLTARYVNSSVEGNLGGGRLTDMMVFTPVLPLGDYDEYSNSGMGLSATNLQWRRNPVDVVNDTYAKNTRNHLRANGSLSMVIMKGLVARTEFSLGTGWRDSRSWSGPVAKDSARNGRGGDASIERINSTNYTWTNTLSWEVAGLSDKHRLSLLAGQEITGNDSDGIRVTATDMPLSFDYNRGFAMINQYNPETTASPSSSSMSDPERMASFFGRVMYTFNDRYSFNATLRADGSSNFAPENRWGYFPAAAFAWRISEESFMKGIRNMDNLKLRLSYGTAGNDRISAGLWSATWKSSTSGYPYNNTFHSIYEPSSQLMVNPMLKWETTITRNVGVDFGFFNNRLHGSIDLYQNTTKDLLVRNSLPGYTGYSEIMDNVGQTTNKGIEFSLGGDLIRQKDLRLSVNANISFNKNNVDELSGSMNYKNYSSGLGISSAAPKDDFVFEVGRPVGLIRGYVSDGFYTTKDFTYANGTYTPNNGMVNSLPILATVPGMQGIHPGMMKLKKIGNEVSQTEINEADDCIVIGDTNPIHAGGVNFMLTWKSFDMMAAFSWSYGNDVYNYTKAQLQTGGKNYNKNFSAASAGRYRLFELDGNGNLNRVTEPGQLEALNANATTYYPFHEFRVLTSEFIEDGSYLRLNSMTVGYTLPVNISKKLHVSRLRVYLTGTNLFTLTNYSGLNPNVNSGFDRNSSYPVTGMDYGTYPLSRTYTFGVNLTF